MKTHAAFLVFALASSAAVGPLSAQVGLELVRTIRPPPPEYFGVVSDVDAWPDGAVAVLDDSRKHLYLFGPDGTLRRTMARKGSGPGELRGSVEMEVLADGSIAVLDYLLQRIGLWGQDGVFIRTIPVRGIVGEEMAWPHELIATANHLYLKVSTWTTPSEVRILRLLPDFSGTGELKTRFTPDLPETTCRFCPIAVASSGDIAAASGDTLYGIARIAGGTVTPAVWTRAGVPAALRDPEELARMNAQARRMAGAEGGTGGGKGFSPYRPRFGAKTLAFDGQNRLWTLPSVPDDEGSFLDVFSPAGRRIATIRLAEVVTMFKIREDALLAGGVDDAGEPVVYVYRIVG